VSTSCLIERRHVMWVYDRSVCPPAPFVDIHVFPPLSSAWGQPLRAKLDTAADISCIPADLVEQLDLLPARIVPVEGYDGIQTMVYTYIVAVEVTNARFRHLEVVTTPEKYALLGRDVLNNFYVQLNGPDLTFHMNTSP
jgi:hypothetical protein